MSSTDTKKIARAIQEENPGMKYTEALRIAQAQAQGATPPKQDDVPLDEALEATLEAVRAYMDLDPWEVEKLRRQESAWRAEQANQPARSTGITIAVAGPTASGKTHFLRSVVRAFVGTECRVSIVDIKGDSFRDFRQVTANGGVQVHTVRDNAPDAHASWVEPHVARAFIEGLVLGSESHPHLVVIDDGDALFEDPDLTTGERKRLVTALERLILSPHTSLAFQSHSFDRALIPGHLFMACDVHLLLGRSSKQAREAFFGGVVSAEELEAFDIDSIGWTGNPLKDVGKGMSWEGEGLLPVVLPA